MAVTLSQQQINDLKELESLHDNIRQEIERAKSAGLDMSEYETSLNNLEGIRQGLLKVYGGTTRRKSVG